MDMMPPPVEPVDPADALAACLLGRGQLDAKALERARRVAAETNGRLEDVLIHLGLIAERTLAEALAEITGCPLATSADYPDEPVLPEQLRPRFLKKARVLPLAVSEDQRVLVLAMNDPTDAYTAHAVSLASGGLNVVRRTALPIELDAAQTRLYQGGDTTAAPGQDIGEPTPTDAGEGLTEDAERLKDMASEAPVIRLVNQIIAHAVEAHASDIHLEPFPGNLRLRYRHDGVLQEAPSPPAGLQAAIISRIKIMARLDIAQRRLPQDGRITLAVRGHDVDFRVSTIPSLHGETVVLRVLDRAAVTFDFAELGLPPAVKAGLLQALDLPNGMILVTGPTGSGKTTTLYTGLLHLNTVVRKIVTVEDPVEYQLEGINQIQVKPGIGLNFASLLRSILRQDPNIIMIGEIRDLETAEIAVQAALTGRLVLSTVHTNSAAATVTRLRDMGLEDYLLAATLRAVLAQRLVRRLCPLCRREVAATPAIVERFRLDRFVPNGAPITLHQAVGCPACHGSGYKGRQAIAEFLFPSDAVQHLIFSRADHAEIERAAVAEGMSTLLDEGLAAAVRGETSLEDVLSSVDAGEG